MTDLFTYWGKELLSTWIVLPIIWYLLKEQKRVHEDDKKIMRDWFNQLAVSIWKLTPPSTEATIELASKFVWAAGTIKVKFIRDRIEKNNIFERQDRIKSQVKAKLTKISYDEYIKPLNKYITKVWPLGDWIGDNFPMDEFLAEIYDVIFNQNIDIDKQIIDIYTLMEGYQNDLWQELRDLLNNK